MEEMQPLLDQESNFLDIWLMVSLFTLILSKCVNIQCQLWRERNRELLILLFHCWQTTPEYISLSVKTSLLIYL